MSELKRKILDAIALIALIVGIIMILWRIFGDSPTDLAIITPFIVLALSKVWSNNEKIWELTTEELYCKSVDNYKNCVQLKLIQRGKK